MPARRELSGKSQRVCIIEPVQQAASTVRKERTAPTLRSSQCKQAERQTELMWSHMAKLESIPPPTSFTLGWNHIKLFWPWAEIISDYTTKLRFDLTTTPSSFTLGWNHISLYYQAKIWIDNNSHILYRGLKSHQTLLPSCRCPVPITLAGDRFYPRPWHPSFRHSAGWSLLFSKQTVPPMYTAFCPLSKKVEVSRKGRVEQLSIVREFVIVRSRVQYSLWKWASVEDEDKVSK